LYVGVQPVQLGDSSKGIVLIRTFQRAESLLAPVGIETNGAWDNLGNDPGRLQSSFEVACGDFSDLPFSQIRPYGLGSAACLPAPQSGQWWV
jgi:hypothetical protein